MEKWLDEQIRVVLVAAAVAAAPASAAVCSFEYT